MNKATEIQQLRTFGLIVGGIFALISLWPVLFHGNDVRGWALILVGLLVIPALVLPRSLGPVFRLWMAVGHALGWINTRIALGGIFYGLFTPIGLVQRFLLGKDPMRRRFEPTADSYRVWRQPRSSSHLRRQF